MEKPTSALAAITKNEVLTPLCGLHVALAVLKAKPTSALAAITKNEVLTPLCGLHVALAVPDGEAHVCIGCL